MPVYLSEWEMVFLFCLWSAHECNPDFIKLWTRWEVKLEQKALSFMLCLGYKWHGLTQNGRQRHKFHLALSSPLLKWKKDTSATLLWHGEVILPYIVMVRPTARAKERPKTDINSQASPALFPALVKGSNILALFSVISQVCYNRNPCKCFGMCIIWWKGINIASSSSSVPTQREEWCNIYISLKHVPCILSFN